ncbi:hypothetical protein [Aeromicrobium sp. CTD01-1L150]|uniref:hypothetical protein n=1 Tax=Aeromicrobium sp. CTD01-1L150 TaxID=3341830 RepID=UPI0035C15565
MRSSGRTSRGQRAKRWRIGVVTAAVLVVGAVGFAVYDVRAAWQRPVVAGSADPAGVSTQDSRRQVLATITVSSDAAFGFTYLDHEGVEERKTSDEGGEISVDVVLRGAGPYLQVWVQSAPTATFARCRIELDGEEAAQEQGDGPGAATYCVA